MRGPLPEADLRHVLEHTAHLWDDLRGERLFLTGGTGFTGTWLTESFVAANRTHGLGARAVLLTRDPGRFRARSPHLADDPAIELLVGDAGSFAPPAGTFAFAIHAATERSYPPDARRPLGIVADDRRATERVLALCARARTARLLFTSTGAIYGPQPPELERLAEDARWTGETSVYGQSKRQSEHAVLAYASAYGFTATIARFFAFVGPYLPLDEGYAIANFLRNVLDGEPVRIDGDGTPLRSYLYAADLAIWLWTILVRGRPGRAYNIGSPEPIAIRALAERVVAVTGSDLPVVVAREPVAGAPPSRYVPSVERAERELGLRPYIGVAEGIRRTYAWHRVQSPEARLVPHP